MSTGRAMPVDPKVLKRLRAICLALPETAEVVAWGHPTFRVKDKIFASVGGGPGEAIIGLKSAHQSLLIQDPRFTIAPYVGKHGWVSFDASAGPIEWPRIEALVRDSYRLIAPKKLAATID
jgi:predicted DNA-binding protein (MmcQ/YjbR family)